MTEKLIPRGKAAAIRILIANDLGLNPEWVVLAEMELEGSLHPLQYARLEMAGRDAVLLIQKHNKIEEANVLAEKYLN